MVDALYSRCRTHSPSRLQSRIFSRRLFKVAQFGFTPLALFLVLFLPFDGEDLELDRRDGESDFGSHWARRNGDLFQAPSLKKRHVQST